MTPPEKALHEAKHGAAVVATCIVQTIEEEAPGFQQRFLERLARAYAIMRDESGQERWTPWRSWLGPGHS